MEKEKTVAFYTLGCKLNAYDTQWYRQQFEKQGYRVVDFGREADVTVVNTCTVTGQGDAQSRQYLRRAKRNSPDGMVVAIGCYAQTDPETLVDLPEVDFVVGTAEKTELLDLINDTCSLGSSFVSRSRATEFPDMDITDFGGRSRAFVKVQEGCNEFCSFCIIPFSRGRSRSRVLKNTVEQVKRLVDIGYQEVVLTGVHIGDYGADLDGIHLIDLLESVEGIGDLKRFRISSIEASYITEPVVDFLVSSGKFCRHLHVPLQSGDDRILKAMRRPYTRAQYINLIETLADRIPAIGIGGDVMVGFPGENEIAFQNTCDLITNHPLAYLHVFPYSPRKKTPAARMSGQVDPLVKKHRSVELRALGEEKTVAFQKAFLGQILEVLFENRRESETGYLQGVSDNYIRVFASGPDRVKDRIQRVRLDRIEKGRVVGEIIDG